MSKDASMLIRGRYTLTDVIELDRLRIVLEKFSAATGFSCGLASYPEHELLLRTGWRDVCERYHRAYSESEKACGQSIQKLTDKLSENKQYAFDICDSGLVNGATPVVIEGTRVANLLTGQVFFEKPDLSKFRKQAEQYGYDTEQYLASLLEVPIVSKTDLEKALSFLSEVAVTISEISLDNLIRKEREEDLRSTMYSIGDAIIATNLNGEIERMNSIAEKLTGWSEQESRGCSISDIVKMVHPRTRQKISLQEEVQNTERTTLHSSQYSILIARNGVEYDISSTQTPITDSNGDTTGMVFVLHDVTEEVQIQNALRSSEERLELAVRGTGAGLWDWNIQTGECIFNERWAEIVGFTLEELHPISIQTWIDLCHPEDLKKSDELLKQHFSGELLIYQCEVRMKHKDGHWVWVQDRGSVAEWDTDGLPLRMAGTHIDITSHKTIAQKQQESEEKYQAYVDYSPVAIFVVDEEGHYTDVNQSACGLLGYTREELLEMAIPDMVSAEDLESSLDGFKLLKDKGYIKEERKLRKKDGSYVDISLEGVALGGRSYMAFCVDITERKQAEEMLRENEEKLRGIIENSTNLFYSHTPEHELTYVSPQSHHFLGCSPEEAKIRWTEFVTDNPINKVGFEKTERAIKTGKPQQPYEVELRTLTGEIVWAEVHEGPVVRDGKTVAIVGALTDITERKRAEEVVEKRIIALTKPLADASEIAFEDMFNLKEIQLIQDLFAKASGVASIITNTDGTPITKPSNFCRLCNDIIRNTEKGCANCYKSDAIIGRFNPEGPIIQPCLSGGLWDAGASITVGGRHIANWLIGQVRDETQDEQKMREYAREIEADEEAFMEAFSEVSTMSREQFDHVANTLYVLANQLSTMAYQNIQQARFITERKQAQDQVTAERKRLLEALDVIPAYIYLQGEDYSIRFANREFRRLFGEPGSKPCYEVLQGLNVPCEKCLTFNVFRTGERQEWEWTSDDGRTYLVFDAPFEDIDGTPLVLEMGLDITEQRQAQNDRDRLEYQLRQAQKLEAIGQLAGGVAHDFNNILTAILGNLELGSETIIEELGSGHPLNDFMREIESSAQRAASLTRQLLAFSRQQIIQPKNINISRIVSDLEPMLRRLVTENIAMTTQLSSTLQPVLADPGQVEQIVVNLVINAADAMPDGGTLTLETHSIILEDDYVSAHPESKAGPHAVLIVSDTGTGMNTDTMERIFEPFFSTKSVEKGTGLGLATVHGIVKQSNGHINVYSEPGHGTTFKVYLPYSNNQQEDLNETPVGELSLRGNETLLLCEDDDSVREMTTAMLQNSGYTVLSAPGGQEALEIVRTSDTTIDMLITDVIMKDMNGRELSEKLKGHYPNMPTLFISGYTANVIAHHGVLDDDVEFLEKPFSHTRLLARIREVLEKNRIHE